MSDSALRRGGPVLARAARKAQPQPPYTGVTSPLNDAHQRDQLRRAGFVGLPPGRYTHSSA